jgi:copper homeostasis protein (lipoprotein)
MELTMTARRLICAALVALLCACAEAPSDEPPVEAGEEDGAAGTPAALTAEPLVLRGIYSVVGPRSLFTDCASGVSYTLARDGATTPVHDAFLLRADPDGGVLASMEAVVRAGSAGVDSLEVISADVVSMESSCDQAPIHQPLEETEWVLVTALGQPVPDGVVATLRLDRQTGEAAGSTGCNNFVGSYELVGTRLQIGAVAFTRMACPRGVDQLEIDVLEAFRIAGSFTIDGDQLSLVGDRGVVARYVAR